MAVKKKGGRPSTPKERGVSSSSSGSSFHVWLPIAIALVVGLGYTMRAHNENDANASMKMRATAKWLDAAVEDEKPELSFLTAPVEKTDPLYAIYPPQRGLHVLKQMGNGQLHVFQDANGMTPPKNASVSSVTSMRSFRVSMESILPLGREGRNEHLKQDWRVFNSQGGALTTISGVMGERLFIIMDGGQWIHPTVRVGHRQTVQGLTVNGKPIVLETLAVAPAVFGIENFLEHRECDHIIGTAGPHVEASPVALMDHDKGKPATEWRTSSQTWFGDPNDALLQGIRQRTSTMLRVSQSCQENAVQVLQYKHGQKYDSHHDFFNMDFYKSDPQMVKDYDHGHKNRLATVFWYMSDVEAGGETQFPRAGGLGHPPNFNECKWGLLVKPRKGKVILFYSLTPDGRGDDYSLHGGCPVEGDGTKVKWAANQWVWNKPFN